MDKVIGVDIGGTSIYAGIVDLKGNILKKIESDTRSVSGKYEILKLVEDLIEELMGEDILGIGIGSPGFIDNVEGKVLKIGGNIKDWSNTDIKGYLSKSFPDKPISVENDANAAALCEHWIGAGKDFKSFVMLTLGTGVGGAIYLDKQGFLLGNKFQGAELGHSILYPEGKKCSCNQRGCVEKYISGSALEEEYRESTGESKSGKDIFKESLEDEICKKIVDEYCKNLAVYLITLKNIFDPQGIIIGGGVINSRQYWWDNMIEYYKKHCNNSETMEIVAADYLNNAGIIGAAKKIFINKEK